MKEFEDSTLNKIYEEAKKEFLEKGFKTASLRNIVKSVGMTTGAFYGYYKSKEELFEALVNNQYIFLIESLTKTLHQINECALNGDVARIEKIVNDHFKNVLNYGYDNLIEFKLLLLCADGTKYENILDKLVDIQESCSNLYKDRLEKVSKLPNIDPKLEHVLVTGMFHTFSELFIHEMPLEKANNYIRDMITFYMAGWNKILSK